MIRVLPLLLVVLVAPGCDKKPEQVPEKNTEAPAPRPPDPLTEAVRNVARLCTVTDQGQVRDCAASVQEELQQAEKARGIVPSLEHYCRLLGDPQPAVRAVAAARIGGLSVHQVLKDRGTEELLGCLLRQVGSRWDDKNIWQGERIARAATFLATALDKHRPLVKFLDKAPARLRRVGYECLWPNGRMRVYDILEEAAGDDDPAIRRAVAMGFAYVGSLKPDEVAKACELLRRLLADPRGEVAAAAAQRLADLCPDSRDKVVQTIAEHLERRSLEPGFITALERLHRATTVPTSTPLKKKAERLLGRIARTRKLQAALRVMALQSLARLTPDTAHKLARRLARDRDATVRRAAENLK